MQPVSLRNDYFLLDGCCIISCKTEKVMELEHAFQQSGFLVALQLMIVGSLLAPGVMGGSALYYRFVRTITSYVVSFGPVAVLMYVLYMVSHLS